jgi:hypothetical protein
VREIERGSQHVHLFSMPKFSSFWNDLVQLKFLTFIALDNLHLAGVDIALVLPAR